MTPDLLAQIGTLLYGPHWHQPLGVALHVSRRNIMRWAAGSSDIPPAIKGELADLCVYRAERLSAAATLLRGGGL